MALAVIYNQPWFLKKPYPEADLSEPIRLSTLNILLGSLNYLSLTILTHVTIWEHDPATVPQNHAEPLQSYQTIGVSTVSSAVLQRQPNQQANNPPYQSSRAIQYLSPPALKYAEIL